nr:recombinase family protein [Brevibacterium renqingii]
MGKLIGYARVSTRDQSTDRQVDDLRAAGVRHDDLYIDQGVSGARASRPQFDRAISALIDGDIHVAAVVDTPGRVLASLTIATDSAGFRQLAE